MWWCVQGDMVPWFVPADPWLKEMNKYQYISQSIEQVCANVATVSYSEHAATSSLLFAFSVSFQFSLFLFLLRFPFRISRGCDTIKPLSVPKIQNSYQLPFIQTFLFPSEVGNLCVVCHQRGRKPDSRHPLALLKKTKKIIQSRWGGKKGRCCVGRPSRSLW